MMVILYERIGRQNHEAEVYLRKNIESWVDKVHYTKSVDTGASFSSFLRSVSTFWCLIIIFLTLTYLLYAALKFSAKKFDEIISSTMSATHISINRTSYSSLKACVLLSRLYIVPLNVALCCKVAVEMVATLLALMAQTDEMDLSLTQNA